MIGSMLLLWSASVLASDDWVIRHFSTAEGLPVSSASAARVDRDGFLWLATHDGLVRFDGRRFETFDMASQPAMDSNRIVGLYVDDHQRLHALTSQGALLKVQANRIERVIPDSTDPTASILHMVESPFCATLPGGLYCHDDNGQFQLAAGYDPELNIHHALPGPSDSTWLISRDRTIWRQPLDGDPQVIETGSLEPIRTTSSPLSLTDGSLLVPQLVHLVQVFRDGRVIVHKLPGQDLNPGAEIISLRRADRQAVWVGTSRTLYRFDVATGLWSNPSGFAPAGIADGWTATDGGVWTTQTGVLYRNGSKVLTSNGVIQDVYVTDDGMAWISTLRDGFYALSKSRVAVIDQQRGLDFENIYGVSLDPEGQIWLGSLSGTVQVVASDSVRRYGTDHGLPGENPWAVVVAADGTVYVATYHPGLYVLRPGSDQFVAVSLPNGPTQGQVRALGFGSEGRLWIGGDAGVWRREEEGWVRFCDGQLNAVTVLTIRHARDGVRWFGTNRGLWREDDRTCDPFAVDQLGEFEIRDVYEDGQGILWVSTQGHGLVRINAGAEHHAGTIHLVRLDRQHGLPSNSLHAVTEDAAGNLWVNSNQGVFRISRTDLMQFLEAGTGLLSPLVLTRADGLRELEGNGGVQPAVARDAAGRIFFPSQSGLIAIDPEQLPLRTEGPVAVIDGLLAGGIEHATNPAPRLPIGQRNVLIRFAAADLRGGQDRFRYRLAPARGRSEQESPWNEALGQNATSFAALAPGRYRFEVLAGNNDGFWSAQAAAVEFTVPAYWYESSTFRFSVLALALLALGLLIHWRIRALRQQAIELNRQVDLRTRELAGEKTLVEQTLAQLADAHQSLEQTHEQIAHRNRKLAAQTDRLSELDGFRKHLLANVSHELRTPLMLIDLPLRVLEEKADRQPDQWDESARRSLTLARRQTDRLAELVSQLVTLVKAESGQLELKITRFDLDDFLDELVQSYQPLAHKQDIDLVAHRSETQTLVFADREQLTTAFGNLIDNAIKHTDAGGRIEIKRLVDADESSVRVIVVDQGHGFDPVLASQLFERFFRDESGPKAGREGLGIGLALAREITELHGGRIGAESRPGSGATFWIELPLGSSHIALADLALDRPGPAPMVTGEPLPDSREQRLALVEDHPELAAYLKERLIEYLPVSLFTTAEQALAALEREPFGLLLSDVMLPGISGIELCHHVRQHAETTSMPVILVSAKATTTDREAALAAGANDYLVKPFSLDDLLEAIGAAWPAVRPVLQRPSTLTPGDPLMTPAVNHLTDPDFGIDDWARAVHLSPRQLRRRVSEVCGQSPLVWLREQRLLRVRQLISTGQCKTLAEAGHQCGLDNPAYLYRIYRARFGENSS